MNIDVKYWSHKDLEKIFDKDILMKSLSKYNLNFNFCRKLSTTCVETHPTRIGKIIHFNERKNDLFYLHSLLSNNIMKFVITSVFVIMLISLLNMSSSNAEETTANFVNIQVCSGDTVWTIAARYASNKEDLRELVFAIKTINGLNHNGLIYSGQTLKVPMPTTFSEEVLPNSPK